MLTFQLFKHQKDMQTPAILLLLFYTIFCPGQVEKYTTISFYNVENLFDPIDDPMTIDEAYTPEGRHEYSHDDYHHKLQNIARVIAQMDHDLAPVSLIGLSELENEKVVEDLVSELQKKGIEFSYIHFDSPDRRGIDVALLYDPKNFHPLSHQAVELRLWDEKGISVPTRDLLVVTGVLHDRKVGVIVNHWPSRRGGKQKSSPKRTKAAYQVQQIIEGLISEHTSIRILIMGDFNDDPIDTSLMKELVQKSRLNYPSEYHLFNPMHSLHLKGYNSMVYRDQLHLFDQILFSRNLLEGEQRFRLFKAGVFNPPNLRVQQGRYRGYPFRSFDQGGFSGGYSDHYPVYLILARN